MMENDADDIGCSLPPIIFILQVVQAAWNMLGAWYGVVVLCNNYAVGRNTGTIPQNT